MITDGEENISTKDRISTFFQQLKGLSLSTRSEDIRFRKKRLTSLLKWVEENRGRIQKAVYDDFQKPATEVDISEVYPVVTEIRHALKNLDRWTQPTSIDAPITYLGTWSEIRYEPKGVCLIISPWNFPFNLAVGPLVSCLAAGNVAFLKPSELTPHTSRLLAEMVAEVFTLREVVVAEGGIDVATHLLTLPFDHIFFTGSPAIGKVVMRAAAENLASVTLELGGKSPAIVDKTANLKDTAQRLAFGKFLNNGQTCIAPDYVMVHETIKDKLVEELKHFTLKLFGDRKTIHEKSNSYGRVVNQNHFDRLNSLLRDSLERGAKVELTGELNKTTHFFHPAILSNVPLDAKVMEEEIFGPILPILTFKDEKEVIELVNGKPKPLALYVFGKQNAFRSRILKETSAGSVCINDCVLQFTHPNLPFGGVNNSGIGKSHGYYGFLAFSNEKPILKQKRGFTLSYLFYPPFTRFMKKRIDLILRWF